MLPCTRLGGSTSSSWQENLHVLLSIGGSIKRLNDTVQEGCLSGLTDAATCLPFTLPLLQRARKARNMAWCLSFPICRNMPSTFAGGNWDSTAGLAWFSTSSTGQSTNEWRNKMMFASSAPERCLQGAGGSSRVEIGGLGWFRAFFLVWNTRVFFWYKKCAPIIPPLFSPSPFTSFWHWNVMEEHHWTKAHTKKEENGMFDMHSTKIQHFLMFGLLRFPYDFTDVQPAELHGAAFFFFHEANFQSGGAEATNFFLPHQPHTKLPAAFLWNGCWPAGIFCEILCI